MILFRLFLSTCAIIVVAVQAPRAIADSKPQVTLGGIFDLSGAGKVWGNTELNSFQMAIEDYRVEHPNFTVNFKIEYSQYQNNKAISAF